MNSRTLLAVPCESVIPIFLDEKALLDIFVREELLLSTDDKNFSFERLACSASAITELKTPDSLKP